MTTVSATQAKQRFAEVIDAAQKGPVRIQRHGRDVVVLTSAEEYDRLREDRWAEFNRLSAIAAERKSTMLLLPYGIPIAIGTIAYFLWMGMLI